MKQYQNPVPGDAKHIFM